MIYIYTCTIKNQSNVGKYIYHSHESHGSYGSGLITFQVFVVSGPFLFRRSPRPQRCWRWGWIGGSMGKPRCPLQGRKNGLHQKMNPRKGLDSKQPETSYESYVYQININWYTVYIYMYIKLFIYININIYLHIWLVLLIPRNRDFFFFDTTQISMAWNWEVGNDGI